MTSAESERSWKKLGGCRCGVDIHAHVVPARFPAYLKGPAPKGWPAMAEAQPCHRHVVIDGRTYRTVSDRCWDVPKRLADMEEMGLSLQAISAMPELMSYWMNAADADELLRYVNDQIAVMVAESGGRLVGLGALPLQDMDRALAALERLMCDPGFVGVQVGSNVNGRPIGAPDFDPFFAVAEELGAAVFVHAVRPCGQERLVGPGQLQQVLAYPGDVGLAAASVICSNLVLRRPRLRIAFSHGGGTLGLLLPRLEEGRRVFPALQESIEASPTEQARHLFYDALVYDEPTLQHLVRLFGETQVMIGTDYPFNFHERRPVARIEAAFADEALRVRLLRDNAATFLGRLSEVSP
ncbi:aminocarboxymuconate-semialdehyde decarboxylase [Bosea lupini]|uniref:2-amino-3-carboxymuconate-6-semialdehyde decarboxylase n=1 Tax=Bosea lupini TaxID=1036779 RepID=A0A1H7YRU0_9HYPH|nr:amidohydrolase family protein [Bosea lupini]SEM48611.1 aminocarboxymuconate-semialdehyde decarboxylase [Bosea lupini]